MFGSSILRYELVVTGFLLILSGCTGQGAQNQSTFTVPQDSTYKNPVDWEPVGDALPEKPDWAHMTQDFWAPHVLYDENRDKYNLYYSARPDAGGGMCLGVAVSDSPTGPFSDRGSPLKCGRDYVNIDPMAFDDPETGKKLLFWGSGSQPIKVRELADDRLHFNLVRAAA